MQFTFNPKKLVTGFRSRLLVIFTVGTAIITTTLAIYYIQREKQQFSEHATERARLLAKLLAGNARLPLYANDRLTLHKLAQETAQQPDVIEVTVSNVSGAAVATVQQAMKGNGRITESVDITSGEEEGGNLALAANSQPVMLGRVLVSLDTANLNNSIRQMTLSIIHYSFLYWLLVSIFSYVILMRMTQSYGKLMAGIAVMQNGNLSERIPVDDEDEPSQVARAFNSMADALLQREADNRALQRELLDSMRLEVQEEKQQIMAKLIQTNRMTSLGLLVSSMAHEINNPNGAIRMDASFLSKVMADVIAVLEETAGVDDDFMLSGLTFANARYEIFRAIENIDRNTNRIEAVIRDLRSYSLGGSNKFSTDVDVNQAVASALTIVRAHGRYSSANIKEKFAPKLPLIKGCRHQLEQVVINLLINALQALPPRDGVVDVGIAVAPEGDGIVVQIKDNGEGIPQENITRIFEPFFSTRLESGGSGLGLYISNFIISSHGGTLNFVSHPGSGTVVTLRLPVMPP